MNPKVNVLLYVCIVAIAVCFTMALTAKRSHAGVTYCQARAGIAGLILQDLNAGLPIERINVQLTPPGDAATEAVREQWVDGLKAEIVAARADHPGEADAQVAYRIFAACQVEQAKRQGREVNAGGMVRVASSQVIADPKGARVAACRQLLTLDAEIGNALASGMTADALRASAHEVADKISPQRLEHILRLINIAAKAHGAGQLQQWFDASWDACVAGT